MISLWIMFFTDQQNKINETDLKQIISKCTICFINLDFPNLDFPNLSVAQSPLVSTENVALLKWVTF